VLFNLYIYLSWQNTLLPKVALRVVICERGHFYFRAAAGAPFILITALFPQ
jgi:hypothetical protein